MNNKRMLIGMTLVLALVLGYQYIYDKYVIPRHPEWAATRPELIQPSAAPGPVTSGPSISSSQQSVEGQPSMGPATVASGAYHVVPPREIPGSVVLGSELKNPTWPIGVRLTAEGAAIDSVTLNGYGASDDPKKPYIFQEAYPGHDDTRSLATRRIVINGQTLDIAGVIWSLESPTSGLPLNTVAYGLDIDNAAGDHVLHITKTFSLDSSKSPDAGHEVTVAYRIKNMMATSLPVRLDFNGPTVPPREVERGADRQVIHGHDKGNEIVDMVRLGIEEFKKDQTTKELTDNNYRLLWAGASSSYFDAIVRPDPIGSIEKATAQYVNPEGDPENRDPDTHDIVITLQTAEQKLSPMASVDLPYKVFFGPKRRDLVKSDYYSAYPRDYGQTLVVSTSWCGACAFPWLIDILVGMLRVFWYCLRDWGLAIICLVVLVRLLLHPITKHSQVSMLKMQKMGPELERLKKKYGDNKEEFAKAQMQLYKEVGFTPILGCLPMFLQMPIWIALYTALQGEIALRQAPFLWGFTWIHDLARPDRLYVLHEPFRIPILGWTIVSLNVLPLVLAVVFYLQQKYTPKPPVQTKEQEQQQKMMQYMSLLFPIFLYTAPSGLNLYILTSTGIGIVESKRIRDHIKKVQDAEKEGKVFVDAKPTRAGRQRQKEQEQEKAQAAEKKGGNILTSWWTRLLEKAEQVRQDSDRKKN